MVKAREGMLVRIHTNGKLADIVECDVDIGVKVPDARFIERVGSNDDSLCLVRYRWTRKPNSHMKDKPFMYAVYPITCMNADGYRITSC